MKKRYLMVLFAVLFIFTAPAYAINVDGIEIHGFFSQGMLLSGINNYYSADTSEAAFQFTELGANASMNFTDDLRMGLQFFSRNLGRTGNLTVVLDWLHLGYRLQDWLVVRGGLLRMPNGLYGETRDQDMLRTSIMLPQSVYPEMTRDYYTRLWGGEIYGDVPLAAAGYLSYKFQVGVYNPDKDDSGLTLMVEDSGFFTVDRFNHDEGVQYTGGLVWETPLQGLRLGATAWYMKDIGADLSLPYGFGPGVPPGSETTVDVDRWSTVYSIEYTWNNLRIVGEYRMEHTENRWPDPGFQSFDSEVDAEGYYIGASYRFTDWFELGSYYSEFYPDKDDKDGERFKDSMFGEKDYFAWQKDLALTARFDINEYWVLKLEGHMMNGIAEWALLQDNFDSSDYTDERTQRDYLFAAKVTFNF